MVCEAVIVCEIHASVEAVFFEPYSAVAEHFLDRWHQVVALHLAVVGLCFDRVFFGLLFWVGVQIRNLDQLAIEIHDIELVEVANLARFHQLA